MTLKQNIRQLMDNTIFDIGFWDPLGLLKNADQARFDRLRTMETKDDPRSISHLTHLISAVDVRLLGEIAGVPFASVKSSLAEAIIRTSSTSPTQPINDLITLR